MCEIREKNDRSLDEYKAQGRNRNGDERTGDPGQDKDENEK